MSEQIPWGVERIDCIYHEGCEAGLPDGSWAVAVAEPYSTNLPERIRAAWWVLTGNAVAFIWPKAGDLERALGIKPRKRPAPPSRVQAVGE